MSSNTPSPTKTLSMLQLLACGAAIPNAVARAKTYIWEAIRSNPGLGRGSGPVNHHAAARLPAMRGY